MSLRLRLSTQKLPKPLQSHRWQNLARLGSRSARLAQAEMARREAGVEAWMRTALACTTLWAGFWFQFVIGMMYDMPAVPFFGLRGWANPVFHMEVSHALPLSLAEIFLGLSAFGSLLALVGVWQWTHGVRGRWRMRALVGGFAAFLTLWALSARQSEDRMWAQLESHREDILRRLPDLPISSERTIMESDLKWIEDRLERKGK